MAVGEQELDAWVRGNPRIAQGAIVELVKRLIDASRVGADVVRFPLGDSLNQPGPDGVLMGSVGYESFVPKGDSYWEVGTGSGVAIKATEDYDGLILQVPGEDRARSTFEFVTPLSGVREGHRNWDPTGQAKWIKERKARQDWADVRVLDGTQLVDWLASFPAVERWLRSTMGQVVDTGYWSAEEHWESVKAVGEPPPLTATVFLASRAEAQSAAMEVLGGQKQRLKLETRNPHDIADFVCATLMEAPIAARDEALGRVLVVRSSDAMEGLVNLRNSLILVATPEVDLESVPGSRLLRLAEQKGHAVIFGGPGASGYEPQQVVLRPLSSTELESALVDAGYANGRAHALAGRCGGVGSALLREIQGLSQRAEWLDWSESGDIAVVALLGGFDEGRDGDRQVVEDLSGKAFGEWVKAIRTVASRQSAPLSVYVNNWRVPARLEAWLAAAPITSEDTWRRFGEVALSSLAEIDPALELKPDQRMAASVYGKTRATSSALRNGIAESLALIANHAPANGALVSTATRIPHDVVSEVLGHATWEVWASASDVLPLLAEAAPVEFLAAVERAVTGDVPEVERLLDQVGEEFFGPNYTTGLIWALETLAWEVGYFARATSALAAIAGIAGERPKGDQASRALTAIFAAWLPQTIAPHSARLATLRTIYRDHPDAGWNLLVSLLPSAHAWSTGTRKPTWRESIPDDWSGSITRSEMSSNFRDYVDLAVDVAGCDAEKLALLVDRAPDLSVESRERLVAVLRTDAVRDLPDGSRRVIWEALESELRRNRMYSDAEWSLSEGELEPFQEVADALMPSDEEVREAHLFSDREFDLYTEKGNWTEQSAALDTKRAEVMSNLVERKGFECAVNFGLSTESTWRAGRALAQAMITVSPPPSLAPVLGATLPGADNLLSAFIRESVRLGGWAWFDAISLTAYPDAQQVRVLTALPFGEGAWATVDRMPDSLVSAYWREVAVNPYELEGEAATAVRRLLGASRPRAAIGCLALAIHAGWALEPDLAMRCLQDLLTVKSDAERIDVDSTRSVLTWVQGEFPVESDEVATLEWGFLPLLDGDHGYPKSLSRKLATDPAFYVDAVALCFRPAAGAVSGETPDENSRSQALNAYTLLHSWSEVPGSRDGESVDHEALQGWFKAVRDLATKADRLDIALQIVGQVLFHAPADSSGLWIDSAVASILDRGDADEVRTGFSIKTFNSRGVYSVDPTGAPEEALALKFASRAQALEDLGFTRFGATLRDLSESYKKDAEQVRRRAANPERW
jgi:hypothetical protein